MDYFSKEKIPSSGFNTPSFLDGYETICLFLNQSTTKTNLQSQRFITTFSFLLFCLSKNRKTKLIKITEKKKKIAYHTSQVSIAIMNTILFFLLSLFSQHRFEIQKLYSDSKRKEENEFQTQNSELRAQSCPIFLVRERVNWGAFQIGKIILFIILFLSSALGRQRVTTVASDCKLTDHQNQRCCAAAPPLSLSLSLSRHSS